MLEFGFCGINYKRASLDVRDKVSFTDNRKAAFARKLEENGILQNMILSTCNRSEVFFFYDMQSGVGVETVKELYQKEFSDVDLHDFFVWGYGRDAYLYLFRVASGMESQVLGEDQILGQVRQSYEFSKTMGNSRKEMNRVVQDAISCAKKVKTTYRISEIPLSVSYVGIRRLEERIGLKNKKVLIIGSGQTALLALKYVHEYEAGNIIICNRTYAHAKALQKEFADILIGNYEERYELMKDCDVVISATSSPHLVVRAEKCPEGKFAFLDLASPRDIDCRLGERAGCMLMNLDMLYAVVEENKRERESLIEESRGMIEHAVQETMGKMESAGVDETIGTLQGRCDEIVQDSMTYLERKLQLEQREKKIVERTLRAGFRRLLREPVLELKKLEIGEQQEYRKVIEQLFQIERECE